MAEIDIQPETNLIESWQTRSDLKLHLTIFEYIDNARDAGALIIYITRLGDFSFKIEDDGRGGDDGEKFLKPGSKHERDVTAMGRYRIALKECSAWLGRYLSIDSRVSMGKGIGVTVDWNALKESRKWKVEDRECVRDKRGTIIRISEIYSNRLRFWNRLPDHIADYYTPAILKGLTIIFDGEPVTALDDPELESGIDEDGEFKGKFYRVKAGIIPKGVDAPFGFTVAFHDRIMLHGVGSRALKEYSTTRFYCYIELIDGPYSVWSLNRFKDGFEEFDDLLEFLMPKLEPLLAQIQQEGYDFQLEKTAGEISDFLNQEILGLGTKAKEKRPEKGVLEGTAKPAHSGRRRRRARVVDYDDVGSVQRKLSGVERFRIFPEDNPSEEIARVEADSIIKIYINTNHPVGKLAFQDPNVGKLLACSVLGNYCVNGSAQRQFDFMLPMSFQDRAKAFVDNLSLWLLQAAIGTPMEKH